MVTWRTTRVPPPEPEHCCLAVFCIAPVFVIESTNSVVYQSDNVSGIQMRSADRR
jgi:hypothetical protein